MQTYSNGIFHATKVDIFPEIIDKSSEKID